MSMRKKCRAVLLGGAGLAVLGGCATTSGATSFGGALVDGAAVRACLMSNRYTIDPESLNPIERGAYLAQSALANRYDLCKMNGTVPLMVASSEYINRATSDLADGVVSLQDALNIESGLALAAAERAQNLSDTSVAGSFGEDDIAFVELVGAEAARLQEELERRGGEIEVTPEMREKIISAEASVRSAASLLAQGGVGVVTAVEQYGDLDSNQQAALIVSGFAQQYGADGNFITDFVTSAPTLAQNAFGTANLQMRINRTYFNSEVQAAQEAIDQQVELDRAEAKRIAQEINNSAGGTSL